MLEVYICVGSSCHLKGSYEIVRLFQELIKANRLQDKVELKASFCLGQCTNGVAVKIGDDFLGGVNAANAKQIFEEKIVRRLKNEYHSI